MNDLAVKRGSSRARALAACMALAATATHAGAQAPVMEFNGPETLTFYGIAVASVADLDGDGFKDIAVGGSAFQSGKGMVRVHSGKSGSVLLALVGPKPSTGFGSRLAAAGDVNADGTPDILVSASSYDSEGKSDRGAVWVHSGLDGALLHFIQGDEAQDVLGTSLAGGLDIDQDGYGDFLVGILGLDQPEFAAGAVRAYSGRTGQQFYTVLKDSLGAANGASLAVLDDIDGDGVADWATSSDLNRARVLSGATGAHLYFVSGPPPNVFGTFFGIAMSRIEDVNGDGFADLLVGAPHESTFANTGGTIRIFSGLDGKRLAVCKGDAFQGIGGRVAGVRDVNGDGVPDILTVSPQIDEERVILYSGATGGWLQQFIWPGLDEQNPFGNNVNFGSSIAGLDDLNGDGKGDFVAGASSTHINGDFAGSVYVYLVSVASPSAYCTAKPNSAGCTPQIGSTSVASLSVGDQFTVTATGVVSQQVGLLAWSLAPATTSFFGGTLCLAPPITRTGAQTSDGAGAATCQGAYSFHFSQAYMGQQGLAAGASVYAQYWQRDPAQPDGTGVGLTDALNFDIVN